jgi:hypothetical protein
MTEIEQVISFLIKRTYSFFKNEFLSLMRDLTKMLVRFFRIILAVFSRLQKTTKFFD